MITLSDFADSGLASKTVFSHAETDRARQISMKPILIISTSYPSLNLVGDEFILPLQHVHIHDIELVVEANA